MTVRLSVQDQLSWRKIPCRRIKPATPALQIHNALILEILQNNDGPIVNYVIL